MRTGIQRSPSRRKISQPFSYVILLLCNNVLVRLNRNEAFLSEGYYAYVGSANIKRPYLRVLRHLLKNNKKLKWHIDYLTEVCEPISALLCSGVSENALYEILIDLDYVIPSIKGFGCSDYKGVHETHLFKFSDDIKSLQEIMNRLTSILKELCDEIEVLV